MSPLRPAQRRSVRLKERARQVLTMSNTTPAVPTPSQGPQVKPGTSRRGTRTARGMARGMVARSTVRGTARGTARGRGARGKAPVHQPDSGTPTEDSPLPSAGNVNWESNPALTNKLIQWLLTHPADRHVLFHDHATSTYIPGPGSKLSGRNKKEVLAVVAGHLFEKDSTYGSVYALDMPKFNTSLNN